MGVRCELCHADPDGNGAWIACKCDNPTRRERKDMRHRGLKVSTSHKISGIYIRGTVLNGYLHMSGIANGKGLEVHGKSEVPFSVDTLQCIRDELGDVIEFMRQTTRR